MKKHLIFLLSSILILASCGEDEKDNANQNPSEPPKALEPKPISPHPISAMKSYQPSRWVNWDENFIDPVLITLPQTATVTNGRSGNHWISLSLYNGGYSAICLYKGTGATNKTKPICGDNGLSYEFEYCILTDDYIANSCSSNPWVSSCTDSALGITFSDNVYVDRIGLTVNNGDKCDTTVVEMTL